MEWDGEGTDSTSSQKAFYDSPFDMKTISVSGDLQPRAGIIRKKIVKLSNFKETHVETSGKAFMVE